MTSVIAEDAHKRAVGARHVNKFVFFVVTGFDGMPLKNTPRPWDAPVADSSRRRSHPESAHAASTKA